MTCSKFFIIGTVFLSVVSGVFAAKDISELRGLMLNHAKIPVYDSQKRMQMMVFVDRAVREGKIIAGENTVLDVVRKGCNVDSISDAWQLKYYSLTAKLSEVVKFWQRRTVYSEGVIITEKANIDQENNRAFGTSPVYFRSPMIDLDGIGFDVNFKTNTIQVNNDVNVVLRMASSDPRKLKTDGIDKADYSFVRAYSDSLLIDPKHNQIMLIGSVRVVDRSSVLACDRLTIFLDREEQKTSKSVTSGIAAEGDNSVSRLLADGNVEVSNGSGSDVQRAVSDHLIYNVKEGMFTFTGDNNDPRIEHKQDVISGKKIVIYRNEQQIRIVNNCCVRSIGNNGVARQIISDRGDIDLRINRGVFAGNVRVKDSGIEITGPRANFELVSKSGNSGTKNRKPADRMLPGGFGDGGLGRAKDLESVEFTDGINVKDVSAGKMNLVAENGKYNASGKYIDFRKNVKFLDSQMTLNAGKMRVMLDKTTDISLKSADVKSKSQAGSVDRIICTEGVKIVGRGENAGTLTSSSGVFHYKQDKLVFTDKVKLVNKKSKLDCDKLELFLKSASGKSQIAQTGVAGIGGKDKILSKAIAYGNPVVMNDASGNLNTKRLTMLFEELPKGSKPTPGMLQAGSSRVTWIACDDGVRLESISGKQSKNSVLGKSGQKRVVIAKRSETDLKKNVAYLYDNVSVDDGGNRMECQKMSLFASAPEKQKSADADIDADPFALNASEDGVPGHIMLNPELELKRVLCERDVMLCSSNNKNQKVSVGGDTGEYLSSTGKMEITAKPPRKAWLKGEGRRQLCDRIIYDVVQDRAYGIGPTVTERYFVDK